MIDDVDPLRTRAISFTIQVVRVDPLGNCTPPFYRRETNSEPSRIARERLCDPSIFAVNGSTFGGAVRLGLYSDATGTTDFAQDLRAP